MSVLLTIAKVAKVLFPIVRTVVFGAEEALGSGKGPEKFSRSLDTIKRFVVAAVENGLLPEDLKNLDDEKLAIIVETVVQSLKSMGRLGSTKRPDAQPSPDASVMNIPAGAKLTIEF